MIKVLLFTEEIGPDGKHIITVTDEKGNPECNGFGKTSEDAIGDLYRQGFHIVLDRFDKSNRTHWKTRRF